MLCTTTTALRRRATLRPLILRGILVREQGFQTNTKSFPPRSIIHGRTLTGLEQVDEHSDNSPFLEDDKSTQNFRIPKRVRQKIVSPSDAVSLVRSFDCVTVSGFVTQGAPESLLKALGERFEHSQEPHSLTLLFGGGPGDYESKGLNHLAKKNENSGVCMLRRTIGGHYGQVPEVAKLALNEEIEAWALPLGSISRMLRAQSTHSPGHITNIGIGTYVDPDLNGGAANEKAKKSSFHSQLVTKMDIAGRTNLVYRALPVDIALIRGTTADSQGNVSIEQESLYCDQKVAAAAAKNSGGLVIAQVKRIATNGSIPARDVAIPGPMVDCVVVVDEEDHDELHPMSYVQKENPVFTGELKAPQETLAKMPLNIRKIIARRAFFELKPNTIVNLGIGLPEGVARVASEEGLLDYITLSTEPGVFGGLPASGRNFGPAYNPTSMLEMNQMFDVYDGGGVDLCFLGAAEVNKHGDVNVSRMSKNRLTGPGGFIDIAQSTRNVCFVTTFTTRGLEVAAEDGKLTIHSEGSIKKFVENIYEKTFSGDEAVRRGQNVHFLTERAVFRRTPNHDVVELVEIAPGVDFQKDILDQMDFEPTISPHLRFMDPNIFQDAKMDVSTKIFGTLREKCFYHAKDHTMYVDLFGVNLNTEDDVMWFRDSLKMILKPYLDAKGPVDMVVNYSGFDIRKGLEDSYEDAVSKVQAEMYGKVKRYTGRAFQRAKLMKQMSMKEWDVDELFDCYDPDENGAVSIPALREGFQEQFNMQLTPTQIGLFLRNPGDSLVDREMFRQGVTKVLESKS